MAKAQQDSAERKKGSVRRAQKYCACACAESSAKLKGLQSRFEARGDGKRGEDGVEQKL